jgi:superfamily II DNA or RNA helicase
MAAEDKNRVLTSKGYAIKKSSLTDPQIAHLKKELTMAPKVFDKFKNTVQSFPIYYESKTRFYVPRHWGKRTFGEPEDDILSNGTLFSENITANTAFPPHPFQTVIINTFIEKGANGLICVPCGYGKTFMALNIAIALKKRFLVVVDKEFLMSQWKAEIENFIKGANVGILQGATCQVGSTTVTEKERTAAELKQMAKDAGLKVGGTKEDLRTVLEAAGISTAPKTTEVNYDVTICMIQTICRQDFPEGFFADYGFTIFDECHHLGAAYFCQALRKIQTRYMLGLSATPDREDGLSKIFEYYLGEPVYKNTQRDPDAEAVVKALWFTSDDPKYTDEPTNYRGELITAKLLNQIAEFEPRNQKILQMMGEYILDPHRYILLISDRISQLDWFYEEIQKQYPECKIGYYVGGMKQTVLDENAATCKILLATYQMTAEGFSVKKLNTIVLTTPRKNVEQASGRIFRERIEERKVAPHIIDVIDSHGCYVRRWYLRNRFYKKCKYTITHVGKKAIEEKKEDDEKIQCMIKF